MFFSNKTPMETVMHWIRLQVQACQNPNGIDVVVKKHTKVRTVRQNRYLMEVCANIVRFYHDTGFIPDGCPRFCMKTQMQKEFWKDHFGVLETHTLSTKEMCDFIDKIQAEMIQQTGGEYEPIIPPDDYLLSFDQMT